MNWEKGNNKSLTIKMKRIFIIMIACTGMLSLISCGGSKEEKKQDEESNDYEIAEEKSTKTVDASQALAMMKTSDCNVCHHETNKIMGPSFNEIAAKYEFTEAKVSDLAKKIINGGNGVWGQTNMTPHPTLSNGDAETMVRYILSLDGETEK